MEYHTIGCKTCVPRWPYGVQLGNCLCLQVSAIYEIAISPDSYEDWPIPLNQMVSWAFEPADEETLRFYIAKGRADAKVRYSRQQASSISCSPAAIAPLQHTIPSVQPQIRSEHLYLVTYRSAMQRVNECRDAGLAVDLRVCDESGC